MGEENMVWWHGVIEDRQDPDKLGKVKVRILGFHNKDKSFIKTEDLYWAYVMAPITSASMNGIGISPIGVVPGTWVIGFFRDGESGQDPIIIGTIGGIPQLPANPTVGFNDPRIIGTIGGIIPQLEATVGFNDPRDSSGTTETLATAPRNIKTRIYLLDGSGAQLINGTQGSNFPLTNHLNEPDTNRIARNESISQTVLQIIKNIRDYNVPIAYGGTLMQDSIQPYYWNEPFLWYNGIYPYVHVEETESGHIEVKDDTPNCEGQLDFDRTGTFVERLTDGSEVHKIVKKGYTIIMSDNHIHIMGKEFDRYEKDLNISVNGQYNLETNGNINIKSDNGGLYLFVNGDANIKTNGNIKIESEKDTDIKVTGNANIQADGDIGLESLQFINLKATIAINLDAPDINLNSQLSFVFPAPGAVEPPQ